MRPFKHCHVSGQVFFVHAAKGAQEIAKSCPDAFHRVAMDFAETIPIIVTRIFMVRVTNRHMPPTGVRDVTVGRAFIGVEKRAGLGVSFDLGLDRRLLSIITDGQTNVARGAPDHAQDGRPVVVHRACPRSIVGATPRRVIGIVMFLAFFASIFEHLVRFRHGVRECRRRFVVER